LRCEKNLLARESSVFCSALVQYLFRRAGLDLTPGVTDKHTTPEDLARTMLPHTAYRLQRELGSGSKVGSERRAKIKARLQKVKQRIAGP